MRVVCLLRISLGTTPHPQCEAFHHAMIGRGSDPHHHHPVSIPDCVISNVVNDEDDELLGGRVTDSVVGRSIMSISK